MKCQKIISNANSQFLMDEILVENFTVWLIPGKWFVVIPYSVETRPALSPQPHPAIIAHTIITTIVMSIAPVNPVEIGIGSAN